MKGKKLILSIFAFVTLVITGVLFAFGGVSKQIRYAKAATVSGFSAELEGGIIFSAEKVYFVDGENTNVPISYKGYQFNSIKTTNDETRYFGDYALSSSTDNSHKSIIDDGDFVMVHDSARYSADDNVNTAGVDESEYKIRQGIMVTLGGYYFTANGMATTNTIGDGAKMDYVSIQATRNGNPIELPNARSYNSGVYQDFTWFIVPSEQTEGHYEISMLYMVGDLAEPLRFDFDFYLLLQSSYERDVEVTTGDEINSYPSKPTINKDIGGNATTGYEFWLGETLNYPTITFDYSRYDLSYSHRNRDVETLVDFEYDEKLKTLALSKKIYNDVETKYYVVDHDADNTIVTLMFTEQGKYNFKFNYIYKYQGEKISISQEQIPFEDINLSIYGYQLKYSKAGFASADMTYLHIVKNNTMIILPNGYTNPEMEKTGDNLGVYYKLIETDKKNPTATVINSESDKTKGKDSDTASVLITKNSNTSDIVDIAKSLIDTVNNTNYYQRTDRGLWLTLNDEYYFASGENDSVLESYYYYNQTRHISTTGSEPDAIDLTDGTEQEPLNKVTTFTKPGYYLVQARYKDGNGNNCTQYFAFQITATTPSLDLRKIDAEIVSDVSVGDSFYAHEYTNMNVYASWKETEVFESSIAGKLYYAKGKYATEAELKAVANGSYSSAVTKIDYTKKDLITESGSYLLVLEVERSATKTYTYFTIDKEKISGLEVYEVVTNSIDNRAIYAIKQDMDLNYIKHTSKSVIDTTFTLDWANKRSGAQITAQYYFTPFIKMANYDPDNNVIETAQGSVNNKYIINEYGLGSKSNLISIQKPTQLNSALDVNNVLTEQGIYEFHLKDEAGNKLVYIVVVDRTEGVVNATYGDSQNKYVNGQMVADYVELEWGTHKAIKLGDVSNDAESATYTISQLINGVNINDYYSETGNNWYNLINVFQNIGAQNLIVIQNKHTEIKLRPFDDDSDNYYILTTGGIKQIKRPNGIISNGWDTLANKLFLTDAPEYDEDGKLIKDGTDKDIKILVDEKEIRRYTFEVVSNNQINNKTNTSFSVYITPDKAQGEVYSAMEDGVDYSRNVLIHGAETNYFKNGEVNIEGYYKAQASNDGVFVFEWIPESDKENFSVTEVKYSYYQLMDQSELNSEKILNKTSKKDLLADYPYYPYKYSSTNYILQTENNIETVANYKKTTRTIYDNKGDIIQSKSINRSEPINLAYETYYDNNDNLVSRKVTQTGLYIITRTISIKNTEGGEAETTQFSYVFFVDRNMIIGYSFTDINQKLVGQFIHFAMPNSLPDGEVAVKYDNFTKQGLKEYTDNGIKYQIYLETNKLPSRVQVPTGKYVSGNTDQEVKFTSYLNLKLSLSVYFKDTYGLLSGETNNGAFVKLIDNLTVKSTDMTKDDYIELSFEEIDNPGILKQFKNSRYKNTNDNRLSLPGVYVFAVKDTVSKKVDEFFEVDLDYCNEFVFGVKLTNNAPTMDMYAYAEIDGKQSDKSYAEDRVLYTNQEFVDFVIPVEDLYSYQAQLDIASLSIWRSNGGNSAKQLWLRLNSSNNDDGFVVDINGMIQNKDRIEFVYDKDGKLVSYIIKLDTGLVVENNQIVSYKEYVYTINISYILKNSSKDYYSYLDEGTQVDFHSTEFKVEIDRTPNAENLNELMKGQGEYFTQYHNWLAEQNGVEVQNNINQTFAYRSTRTAGDYYGLTNDLYYQFASKSAELSNQAMYAFSVNYNTTFSGDVAEMYYREIEFNNAIDAKERMGLLPITSTYFETSQYYTFNENLSEYSRYNHTTNTDFINNGKMCYRVIMGDNGKQENYENNFGKFYEIIEKDRAGNYTQYVIYFASETQKNPIELTVYGKLIGEDEPSNKEIVFGDSNAGKQPAFMGINNIVSIKGIADKFVLNEIEKDSNNPYYANINIYNPSRENIKIIYINSTSTHTGNDSIENQILNTIKEQGNYIIEIVNVFGQKQTIVINNYTSDKHKLNTATLQLKTDYQTGQYYIKFSGLNTKIDETTYWYVKSVNVNYYSDINVKYNAELPVNGVTTLKPAEDSDSEVEVTRAGSIEPDRLNLASGIQYLITITDVAGISSIIPISTSEGYYAYQLQLPDNVYSRDNIYYTANQVGLSFNKDLYEVETYVYVDGNINYEEIDGNKVEDNDYYKFATKGSYTLLTLKPDVSTEPANHFGSLRRFEVVLKLKGDTKVADRYNIYIDTRMTDFTVENLNKENRIDNIKSTLNYGQGELCQDYNIMDLIDRNYYNILITETINVSWSRITNDYFTYNYQLFEFVNSNQYKELIKNSATNEYTIAPKEETTGKYILKVTVEGKDGTWIASRVYGIYMSTTITGLYEVKDDAGELYDHASITNLTEIVNSIGKTDAEKSAMAEGLGFKYDKTTGKTAVQNMMIVFENFGMKTAIPMYIANKNLELHSNKDNGVDDEYYSVSLGSYATISFYRIWRSNYLTFAVIMEVEPNTQNQSIVSTLTFFTSNEESGKNDLLSNITNKTIYDANAEYYKLMFTSYNKNAGANPTPLEKHNKIIVKLYYNNSSEVTGIIKGGNEPNSQIDFNNSGTYRLEISDIAGNVQTFRSISETLNYFTLVVMRKNDMLYTINGEAPVQYAYYDSEVALQINRYNEATGKNNYDINTISLIAYRNSARYTGYEHPTESATYIFKEYGTYLVKFGANLLNTGERIDTQIVFTILNPNEARTALDFTSIYGYNIISVFSVTKTAEKDVTDKFMNLLQDKSNVSDINVYNKLITYERVVNELGTSTQGKMKFKVLYEVENDLLPARRIEFSFTLNNETATLNSSIKPGGKTTKEVTIKFNAANIYDQIGDCYLVVNGKQMLKIDENSLNQVSELKLKEVGKYYVQLMGDSGNIATSFNFTIKEPLNMVAIILIVIVAAIVISLVGTFIWLRTRMKVR